MKRQMFPTLPLLLFAGLASGAVPIAPSTASVSSDLLQKLTDLNAKFSLSSPTGTQLRFNTGEGGLICADIKNSTCTGRVYLLGAHVTAWQTPTQEPVLFMSSKSPFALGKPIRGGVPICFPWFAGKSEGAVAGVGGAAGPSHGTVRTTEWQVEETKELGQGKISITLGTHGDAASKLVWPGDYDIHEHIIFGSQLQIELIVKNTGKDTMKFEEALHCYFAVKDVSTIRVLGLQGAGYLDKTDGRKQKKQDGPLTFAKETDSIYLATKGPYTIADDAPGGRFITIEKTNSLSTIVWNPGAIKAVADLGPGEWKNYVAVETANVGDSALDLKPGETHTMGVKISARK